MSKTINADETSDNVTDSNVADSDVAQTFWPDASLLGVAIIWGVNIPLMKTGLDDIDPYAFNAVRLLVSAIVLCMFAIRERRRGILPAVDLTAKSLLGYAAIVTVGYQTLFLVGISMTTPGNVALIIATVPMWTALLARIFAGEKLKLLAWFGLAIALAGTAVVALQGDVAADTNYLVGNLIILGSALLWSCGTVYSRSLLTRISPLQLAATAGVIAWPVHAIVAGFRSEASVADFGSIPIWLIILYSGIFSSGLSQPMWHFGVKHAGAAHAAVVQNLIPVVAIGAAWIGRGETPTAAQIWGGTLILSGLIAMRMTR